MKSFKVATMLFLLVSLGWLAPVSAFDLGGLGEKLKKVEETVEKVDKKVETVKHETRFIRGDVSASEERQIGRDLAATLVHAAPPVSNARVQRYINRVGRWVAEQSGRADLDWTFAVLDTDSINAFAAPGGYVFITQPLFLLLENEAQLAAVLAHEIAHIEEKHHIDALQKRSGAQLITRGLLDAGRDRLDDGEQKALDKLVGAGKQLYTSGLDRGDELAADRQGAVLAARAGYDPYALLSVLALLDGIDPDDKAMALMTHTHPAAGERLAALEQPLARALDDFAGAPQLPKRLQRHQAMVLKK
ncbi:MAG: M48 family metalloprotease [Pseudomonadota bacterium]